MGFVRGSPKEQADQAEKDRLKVWCSRCWTYVDQPHDCNNTHRPLKEEPKLVFP